MAKKVENQGYLACGAFGLPRAEQEAWDVQNALLGTIAQTDEFKSFGRNVVQFIDVVMRERGVPENTTGYKFIQNVLEGEHTDIYDLHRQLTGRKNDFEEDVERAMLITNMVVRRAKEQADTCLTRDVEREFIADYSEYVMVPHTTYIKLVAGSIWRSMQGIHPGRNEGPWTERETFLFTQHEMAYGFVDSLRVQQRLRREQDMISNPHHKI